MKNINVNLIGISKTTFKKRNVNHKKSFKVGKK